MLASLLIQSGRLAEARGVYEDLVRLKPDQVAYRLTLSTLLLQMQDATGAAAQWRRVLELDPMHVEAMQNLTRLLLSTQRNPPEALALAQRLVELQPTGASYDLLGWASYANGQKTEAIAAASRAVELDPNNRTFRERLQKLKPAP